MVQSNMFFHVLPTWIEDKLVTSHCVQVKIVDTLILTMVSTVSFPRDPH